MSHAQKATLSLSLPYSGDMSNSDVPRIIRRTNKNTERLWIPRDLWRIRKNACNLCVNQGKSRPQTQRCLCYYRCILVGRRMDRFWWHPQPAIYRCITSANFNLDRILILHNHRFGLARCGVGNFESPCQQVVVAPQPPATGLP